MKEATIAPDEGSKEAKGSSQRVDYRKLIALYLETVSQPAFAPTGRAAAGTSTTSSAAHSGAKRFGLFGSAPSKSADSGAADAWSDGWVSWLGKPKPAAAAAPGVAQAAPAAAPAAPPTDAVQQI